MNDGACFRSFFHTEISHNGEKETKLRFSRSKRPLEIVESKSGIDCISRPKTRYQWSVMERKPLFVLLILSSLLSATAQSTEQPEPVRVLILGTYHFDNPGLDLHNVKADDVRTPEKQAELADVASRLARFNPNKIAVEAVSDRADLTTKKFDGFTPETLIKDRDERVQIAFRLAHNLGQKLVYGIDELSDKIDYFPYDKVQAYAKAHGQTGMLDSLNAQVVAIISKMGADQKTKSVREMLLEQNRPDKIDADHYNFYYALLSLGDSQTRPGADLNGYWYLRNAKIFAKLTQIAKPGDRVVVTFGAGHCYWLRHFARDTPGFALVEANDYLR